MTWDWQEGKQDEIGWQQTGTPGEMGQRCFHLCANSGLDLLLNILTDGLVTLHYGQQYWSWKQDWNKRTKIEWQRAVLWLMLLSVIACLTELWHICDHVWQKFHHSIMTLGQAPPQIGEWWRAVDLTLSKLLSINYLLGYDDASLSTCTW